MKSTNRLHTLTLCIMAAGFTLLVLKGGVALNNQAETNEELMNAITLLNEDVKQVNEQLHSSSRISQNSVTGGTVTTNDGLSLPVASQDLLKADDGLKIVEPGAEQHVSGQPADMIVINPTPEQNKIYEDLKSRLDDVVYIENMSLIELKNLPEMQQLDGTMQMLIINKLVEKFNNGQISKEALLAGTTTVN